MHELEQFSTLVGDIYDAALDPLLWPAVLRRLCDFVPGAYGNIFIQDAANRHANSVFTWGMDPDYFRSYLETYGKTNPLMPAILLRDVGEVFSTFDLMPRAQLEETRLYREWVQPQGILDSISAVLEKTSTSCAILALPQHASAGLVTDAKRERMRLVVPHVRRAVLMSKALDLRTVAAEDFAAALDAVAAAIYLVDAERRIVHANQSGHAVLAARDALSSVNGHLRAQDRMADRSLRDFLDASSKGDNPAISAHGAALHLPSRSGEHYVAHALSLTVGARRETARAHRATAVLFVHKARRDLASPPEVMARAYRLTARELAVLLVIVESGGIANAAKCLGLSQATVKTHLRQVFIKTGTARQSELVKLVAGFTSPAREVSSPIET